MSRQRRRFGVAARGGAVGDGLGQEVGVHARDLLGVDDVVGAVHHHLLVAVDGAALGRRDEAGAQVGELRAQCQGRATSAPPEMQPAPMIGTLSSRRRYGTSTKGLIFPACPPAP